MAMHLHILYIDMYASHLGEELRALLVQHGSFDAVEVQVQKKIKDEESNKLRGGWHTEISLKRDFGWTQ